MGGKKRSWHTVTMISLRISVSLKIESFVFNDSLYPQIIQRKPSAIEAFIKSGFNIEDGVERSERLLFAAGQPVFSADRIACSRSNARFSFSRASQNNDKCSVSENISQPRTPSARELRVTHVILNESTSMISIDSGNVAVLSRLVGTAVSTFVESSHDISSKNTQQA